MGFHGFLLALQFERSNAGSGALQKVAPLYETLVFCLRPRWEMDVRRWRALLFNRLAGDRRLRYRFGEHVLDVGCRELRRGAALISVEPQVFDLVVYLIRNRDRVVSKDDLIDAVWGGRIVSDSALTTRINAARTAIDDSGKAQELIRTFPRKGFRFVGVVVEEAAGVGTDLAQPRLLPVVVRAEARAACVLMGDDEVSIRSALRASREAVVSSLESRGARILSTPTDTVIAVFPGAAIGIAAASAARQVLAEINRNLPEEARVHYRFGIAFGDFNEGSEGPAGQALDRTAALAARAHPDAVRLSEEVQASRAADPSTSIRKIETDGYEIVEDGVPAVPC